MLFFRVTLYENSPVDVYKFIFLSAIVPFSEELFYRGLLYHTFLRNIKNWYIPAILVSLIFAVLHLTQGTFAFMILFILSIVLCYLAYLTEGIISGLLVHICWNALYYNKLLISTSERWIFNIVIVMCIACIAWISLKFSKRQVQ